MSPEALSPNEQKMLRAFELGERKKMSEARILPISKAWEDRVYWELRRLGKFDPKPETETVSPERPLNNDEKLIAHAEQQLLKRMWARPSPGVPRLKHRHHRPGEGDDQT